MTFLVDESAIIVEVVKDKSNQSGKPFTLLKALFSGTGTILTVFVTDNTSELPPLNTPFACRLPMKKAFRGEHLEPHFNKDAQIKVTK